MFKEWLKEFGVMLAKLLICIVAIVAIVAFASWVAQVMITSLLWGGIIIGAIVLVGIGIAAFVEIFDKH